MATSDTRTGFRLPWATEHPAPDDEPHTDASAASTDAEGETGPGVPTAVLDDLAPAMPDAAAAPPDLTAAPDVTAEAPSGDQAEAREDGPTAPGAPFDVIDDGVVPATRPTRLVVVARPAKFLADLTKAMQLAAESERQEALGQYQAEAKAFIEQVRAEASERGLEQRKRADADVVAIRDWSKAEIARIRDETDRRISGRKAELEEQLERHAARTEREIERVQAQVDAFAQAMASFFEGLLTIDDPARFAATAASLPEPPPFAVDLDAQDDAVLASAATTTAELPQSTPEPDAQPVPAESIGETEATPFVEAPGSEPIEPAPVPAGEGDEAHAEPVAAAQDVTVADEPAADPRIAALGLTPDFAAAEAEAAEDVVWSDGSDGADDAPDVPELSEDTVATRLASLVSPEHEPTFGGPRETTQLVVVGLVSVASVAGFKRNLSRIPGVQSVGVSSGPDGEFVFTCTHAGDVSLRESVPTMQGFQARLGSAGDGVLHITARDPESPQ